MEPAIPVPVWRKESVDHPEWSFELKVDGFRGLADTVRGRMLSRNRNHVKLAKAIG